MASEAFEILMRAATRDVVSSMGGEDSAKMFEWATTEAIKLLASRPQWSEDMGPILAEAAKDQVQRMPWIMRALYGHYVAAAYDLVADVHESMRKRFVTGGEGETWHKKKGI